MELDNLLSISGYSGLHKLVTTRSNGLVVEDLDTGKRSFVSLRKHQFTPLESVGIYTYTDVVDLKTVFTRMQNHDSPPPAGNEEASEMHNYFREILPDYDEERVFLSDIRKLVKWYGFLAERNLIATSDSDEEE